MATTQEAVPTITRILDPINGKEYGIAEKPTSHTCIVELSSNEDIDWTSYSVSVYDITAKTTETKELVNENGYGVAKFLIPLGHQYTVTMPTISDYTKPATRTYTASELLVTRYVTHEYLKDYELLDIHAALQTSTDDTIAILANQLISIFDNGTLSVIAEGRFDSEGRCNTIQIAYGTSYTILFPEVAGYTNDYMGTNYTAEQTTRDLLITYSSEDMGLFGIDKKGNHYTYSQASTAISAGTLATSDIVAIGFNNNTLAHADRGDGKTNCGFCISTDTSINTSTTWAGENIAFNPNKMPFITSHTAGVLSQLGGKYNTTLIRQLGASGEDCGTWTKQSDGTYTAGTDMRVVSTSAATHAASKTHPVYGTANEGFLPSYAQIYYLSLQITALKAYFTLLGKTAPTITSGVWWTSCQYSETGAVLLYNGGFYGGDRKTSSGSVLLCFDL